MKKLLFLLLWIPLAASLSRAQSDAPGHGDPIRYLDNPSLTEQQRYYAEKRQNNGYAMAWHYVDIDLEAFEQNTLIFHLPDGSTWSCNKRQDQETQPGYRSWSGRSDDGAGYANFVLHGEMVTAELFTGQAHYLIYPLTDRLHLLVRQAGNFPDDETPKAYEQMMRQGEKSRVESAARRQNGVGRPQAAAEHSSLECHVRVLLVLTSDVWIALADPQASAILYVDNVNTVYENSAASPRLELARTVREGYDEAAGLEAALVDFQDPDDGKLDGIHDLREAYDADLCVLIMDLPNETELCGKAYTIGSFLPEDAFCVVKESCILGNYSLAHELGHLYGSHHDHYALGLVILSTDDPNEFAYGYVNLDDQWRTVMAYNDECEDSGFNCTRIPYFSNPDLSYGGDPLGIANECDNSQAHDNSFDELREFQMTVENKVLPDDLVETGEIADVLAENSIENEDVYYIEEDAIVTWRAASGSYRLRPGFRAYSGSTFATAGNLISICTDFGTADAQPEQDQVAPRENPESPAGPSAITQLEVAPNPAHDKAVIRFSLSRPSVVFIDIISLTGSTLASLSRGQIWPEGDHILAFDCSALPAGVYFCRLQTGEDSRTVRVVCLK